MTPNAPQEQLLRAWNARLQEWTSTLAASFRAQTRRLRSLIARSPTDPAPLTKELSAIEREVDALSTRIDEAWSKAGGVREELLKAGPDFPATLSGMRVMRESQLSIREAWLRLREHWRLEHVRAFWPYVAAALHRPPVCSECGVPLELKLRHVPQTITCGTCGSRNAVTPAPHVTAYFALAPEVIASAKTLEARFAILRRRNHRENERLAASATGRPLPDDREAFHELEAMERDYWVAFARAKASVDGSSAEDQARLVGAAMLHFHEEEARRIVPPWSQHPGNGPSNQAARHAPTVEISAEECVFPLLVPRRRELPALAHDDPALVSRAHDMPLEPRHTISGACVVDARRDIGPTGTVVMPSGGMALNATIAAEHTSFPEARATLAEEPSAPVPTLTAAQHAEVLAHVMFGGGGAVFARWGLENAAVRQRVLDDWARRLRQDPVEPNTGTDSTPRRSPGWSSGEHGPTSPNCPSWGGPASTAPWARSLLYP